MPSQPAPQPENDPGSASASGGSWSLPLGVDLGGAALIGLIFVVGIAGLVIGIPLPGRPEQQALTVTSSAVGDFIARCAALMTMGALAGITFFTTTDTDGRLGTSGERLAHVAVRAGQVWAWASLFETFANTAFVNGVPMAYLMTPATWWEFQFASPSGLAWLISTLVAIGCVIAGATAHQRPAFALGLGSGMLALTFVGVTGSVTVGLGHDHATDAAIWGTLATSFAMACTLGVLLLGRDGGESGPDSWGRRVLRDQRVVWPFLVLAILMRVAIANQQLAGTAPTASLYGQVSILLVALLVLWLIRCVTQLGGRHGLAGLRIDGVLTVLTLATLTAENHVPSPRFLVPQTVDVNYLGYTVDIPWNASNLLGLGRPNWLWVGMAAFALVTYAIAVNKVVRGGGHWGAGRTTSWAIGWLLMGYLAVSGFWMYSTAVYSWHMLVHMTVNMLVPTLCVLGAPFTLLRACSKDRTGQLPGPAEVVDEIRSWRPYGRILSTPLIWVNYVGSLFLIYFTPLFPWLMRYHWAHQLMLLYFMVTGYLFFGLIVGVDKQLHTLPHLVRLALVISIMPFHAMFAVGIMSSKTLIGGEFYKMIAIPWVGDLMADQNTAGQITWLLGEIPLFIVMLALAFQWFLHDRAENKRVDAAMDAGDDTSLDAYNDMLAELAARDESKNKPVKRIDL